MTAIVLVAPQIEVIKAAIAGVGGRSWDTATEDLTLFGLRRRWAEADGTPLPADAWDDAIGWFARDPLGQVRGRLYRATTDPGRPILENPKRAAGAFCLRGGPHRELWVPGIHHGRAALVHRPGAVAYGWRDGNRDRFLNPDKAHLYEGNGINLHDPGSTDPARVGFASEGCQVVWRSVYLAEILAAVERQERAGHGRAVSYVLIEEEVRPEIAGLLASVRP